MQQILTGYLEMCTELSLSKIRTALNTASDYPSYQLLGIA